VSELHVAAGVASITARSTRPEPFLRGRSIPHADREGVYRGRFNVALSHQVLEAAFPLRAGATHSRGAYHFTIVQLERRSGGLAVLARESGAQSMFSRRPLSQLRYFVRNLAANQAIEALPEPPGLGSFIFPVGAWSVSSEMRYGFFARRIVLDFQPREGQQLAFAVDGAWLKDASLVITRTTPEAAVERAVEIPDFPLREESISPAKTALGVSIGP
jgi:hypothetical protein